MSKNVDSAAAKSSSNRSIPGLGACFALLHAKRIAEFELSARSLTERFPRESKPLQLLGVAALMQGRLQEAVDRLQAAARLNQNDPSIWDNLGVALNRAGHYQAAAECFQGSVRLNPDAAAVWVNAAANFADMGDHVLARNTAARAVDLAPDLPEAHLNLGNALRLLGDTSTAVKALLRAIELDPECAPAHMGLARALQGQNQYDLAMKHAREAIRIDPDYLDGKLAYAILCGDTEQVVDLLGTVLRARPNDMVIYGSRLFWILNDLRFDPQALMVEARGFSERFEHRIKSERRSHLNERDPDRALRVGFVAGDLRRHATAYHLEPLWQGLAALRDDLEVIAYNTSPSSDDMTERLKGLVSEWVEASDLSDVEFDERVRADAVDILIDCSGHTSHNRIGLFMHKPAPIQAHWLAYINTTGLECMDYYIADPVLAPQGLDNWFSEKFIRLPTYAVQLPPVDCEVGPLPASGSGCVTFGSLNRTEKINEQVVALWAQVLVAVPGAKMLLGVIPCEVARDRIAAWFERNGVNRARLEFHGRLPEKEYMALHNRIDLLLDTFPFSGGTTTTNALWMGVPVLTLAGATMPQRQSAARLSAVGLEDWVAHTPEAFIQMAQCKASDLQALSELRKALPAIMSASSRVQPAAFADAFVAGLRAAWRRWCATEAPAAIDVSDQGG